jgi:hypothetical protein
MKMLAKRRNLDGMVKDAQRKTAEYEKKVLYFVFINMDI